MFLFAVGRRWIFLDSRSLPVEASLSEWSRFLAVRAFASWDKLVAKLGPWFVGLGGVIWGWMLCG